MRSPGCGNWRPGSPAGYDDRVATWAAPDALLRRVEVAQRIADSKAIGSACRYGMRSIEDCYAKNEKASKAAIFDGWKEMDQYMRDNKIDGVPSKEDKAPHPVEEVIDEKASDTASAKDKPKPKAKPPA